MSEFGTQEVDLEYQVSCKRKKFMRYLIILFLCSCSLGQLREHDSFREWFIGKPGLGNTILIIDDSDCKPVDADSYTDEIAKIGQVNRINGERHPFYLWLRFPEVILNPQGGFYMPERKYHFRRFSKTEYRCATLEEGDGRGFGFFMFFEAGLIDYAIPYRLWTSDKGLQEKVAYTITCWFTFPIVAIFKIAGPLIIYTVHDVAKILVIPPAAMYSYQEQ